MKESGYILPSEPYTEELLCLRVYIPARQEYLEAFAGQYHDLGQWLTWEKEEGHGAAIAASVWKDAIDFTYQEAWLGGCMSCDEIYELLSSIKSSIVALSSAGGGCTTCLGEKSMCCCCGCETGQTGDEFNPDDLVEIPPPPSDEGATVSDAWKCDASNQIVDNWAAFWEDIGLSLAGGFALDESLALVGAAFATITVATAIILVIVTGLASLAAAIVVDKAKDWFNYHHDELVCLLYESTSPASAYNAVMSYIESFYNVPTGGVMGSFVKFLVKQTMKMSNWNMLYQESSFVIDISNQESVCTSCGTPIPPPDPVILPDPVIATGLLFTPPNEYTINLTEGGYQIADGEQVYYNVLYHIRAKYYSGATSSGYGAGVHVAADFENGYDNEVIENLQMTIQQQIGYSGETNGDEFCHVWGLDGMDVWIPDTSIPVTIQAAHRFRATDKNNEFDILFYFQQVV